MLIAPEVNQKYIQKLINNVELAADVICTTDSETKRCYQLGRADIALDILFALNVDTSALLKLMAKAELVWQAPPRYRVQRHKVSLITC